MRKLISRTPRLIEGLAKWLSIVGGAVILTSCTLGAVKELSLTYLLFGLGLSALMVGWVFAVARLNAEVKLLRDRSSPPLARTEEPSRAP